MKNKKRIEDIPRSEGEIVAALMPLEPISPATVPEAGGTDIAVYDGRHRGLRIKTVEEGLHAGGALLTALLFLLVLMPNMSGTAAMLIGIIGTVGIGLGIWKGAEFAMSLRQLHGHDARLYLPEGMTEDDARFENHARTTVESWNSDAGWRDMEAGDVARRYLIWRNETFSAERLTEGLTPERAFTELDAMARERDRLASSEMPKEERTAKAAELSVLYERWTNRTFKPAKLAEDGFTPAQVRLEFDAFRIEAARIEEQTADLRRKREKIVGDLGRFSRRALKAPEHEERLLPAPAPDGAEPAPGETDLEK